jgi:hypothetical protein
LRENATLPEGASIEQIKRKKTNDLTKNFGVEGSSANLAQINRRLGDGTVCERLIPPHPIRMYKDGHAKILIRPNNIYYHPVNLFVRKRAATYENPCITMKIVDGKPVLAFCDPDGNEFDATFRKPLSQLANLREASKRNGGY